MWVSRITLRVIGSMISPMLGQILRVALAFVGVIVGAGFASGQEIMQYFVGFGLNGMWGVAIAAVVMSVMAMIILQLGSYFRATEHGRVFDRIANPTFSRLLDLGVLITLFSTGFVMFAGAGSNLNQQWGWPIWAGALVMVALVLAAGFLDVDKVTTVIGAITPFIIVFITVACLYVIFFVDRGSVDELNAAALEVGSTMPHWSIAAVNYVGFNLMVAVSMAIVIGGSMFNPQVAGRGGLLGGLLLSGLIAVSAITLFLAVETVGDDELPMLTLINDVHPVLGQVMAIAVYGMIFNTALGMFYAFAKRLSVNRPERFRLWYFGSVGVGFLLSFFGFRNLVGYVYPILGYIGLLLIAIMLIAWVRERSRIAAESDRRLRLRDLWLAGREDEFMAEVDASNLDETQIRTAVRDGR